MSWVLMFAITGERAEARPSDKELTREFKKRGSYYSVAKVLGVSASTAKARLEELGYKSSYSQETGKTWVKLSPSKLGPSRVIPIAGALIDEMGFKPDANLYGRWEFKNGKLRLHVVKIGKGKGVVILE